jgi:hypothetical protein
MPPERQSTELLNRFLGAILGLDLADQTIPEPGRIAAETIGAVGARIEPSRRQIESRRELRQRSVA